MKHFLIGLLILLLSACASSRGFDRGTLRGQISEPQVVTEEDIQKVLELKPQLPQPFNLAIYFAQPSQTKWRYNNSWKWSGEDKDLFLEIKNELKDKGIASDIFALNDSIMEGSDLVAIRLAAARAGADAVLVVNGVSDLDRYNNALGITYVLLVPAFFIPGTTADALFMVNASMWDVRNQYLYMSVEAEGMADETRPAYFLDEEGIIQEAKTEALASITKEISSRLERMSNNDL